MREFTMPRNCAACGQKLSPFDKHTFTVHEFYCYMKDTTKIPDEHREVYAEEYKGWLRSQAAKRGAETEQSSSQRAG